LDLGNAIRHQADVVVVGSGLAGMMAALTAREQGASVALVAQGKIGEASNSWLASGGLAAVTGVDPEDSPENHLKDIERAARGLAIPDIARVFVDEAGPAIRKLEDLGVQFHRRDGDLALFPAPGHSRARSVRCEGGGAVALMTTLIERARERAIDLVGDLTVVEVLKSATNEACGVLAWGPEGWVVFEAKSVVLACGGMGRLFPLTSNHELADGSGYYLALKAGATLTDLEFVQFTPTSLAWPPEVRGTSTGGGLMAQPGVQLLNANGERFMTRYDPERMEAATRDVLSRAIFREVSEGRGTANNAVYVDISATERSAVEQVSGRFLRAIEKSGIDPYRERVEVAPDVHFAMGGVVVDTDGRTAVPGLFAAGEITVGLHGATRLNSNGLTEAAVFGIRAGRAAAAGASHTPAMTADPSRLSRVVRLLITSDPRATPELAHGDDVIQLPNYRHTASDAGDMTALKTELAAILNLGAGIERSEQSITEAISRHSALAARIDEVLSGCDPDIAFRLEAAFVLSRLILRASQLRDESRGAHYRIDRPDQHQGWRRHIVFTTEAGKVSQTPAN